MQLVIEERHATRASRDNLWRVLDELSLWPDWDPYIVSLQRADGVDPGRAQTWVPGARWDERVRRGPFTPRFRMTVSGITPGYYVEWTTRYLGIQVTHGWGIEERDQERNIVSRETFNGTAPLIWFARPLFRLFRVRRMTQRSLRALAQRAETLGS
jgi:hypothetical protein